MSMKCPKCGEKVTRAPIRDKDGNLIVKNLLYMDMFSILVLIAVVLIVVGYNQVTEDCQEVMERPYTFCGEYCESEDYKQSKLPQEEGFDFISFPLEPIEE